MMVVRGQSDRPSPRFTLLLAGEHLAERAAACLRIGDGEFPALGRVHAAAHVIGRPPFGQGRDRRIVDGRFGRPGEARRVEGGNMLAARIAAGRSEEHTPELQSLMRISYAVFCLKKKKKRHEKQSVDGYR